MAIKILAVDDNPVNLRVVTAALAQEGYQIETAGNGLEALTKVNSFQPDLLILDIAMPDLDGYEVCRRLRSNLETAHLPVIMLTAYDTLDEKIKGFEAGADDFLVKPFQPAELIARIKVLTRRSIPALPTGEKPCQSKAISVFSLKGGVGVSTIATNLAVALNEIWNKPVALIDLAFVNGQSALMLNLPLRHTWSDLAKLPSDELDGDLILETMLTHENGLRVLASPRNVGDAEMITREHVERVLEAISTRFEYLVLDLPHDFSGTTLAGISTSNEFILPLAPELASVKTMVGLLEVFNHFELPKNNMHILLNWTFKTKGLARNNIEAALKQPIEIVIPFVSEAFITATNLGIPSALGHANDSIRILFEDLAWSMSKQEEKDKKQKSPTETLQRIIRRKLNVVKTK
jgi:pilus assembly protein CpaE